MTTIAYKDGLIAYDSRITQNDHIASDDYDKHREVNGVHFFLAGHADKHEQLIDDFMNGRIGRKGKACSAIVWDGTHVWECAYSFEGFWRLKDFTGCFAVGSGQDHAITAMDMGADAVAAVHMAMKRDCKTGGNIRTFLLIQSTHGQN